MSNYDLYKIETDDDIIKTIEEKIHDFIFVVTKSRKKFIFLAKSELEEMIEKELLNISKKYDDKIFYVVNSSEHDFKDEFVFEIDSGVTELINSLIPERG